jgi:RNA polymerase sigma factor for flagellar operon FliA
LQAREQIILAYAHLAKYVVDRMPIRPSAVTSYDDLVSHAVVGLIDAVEKYDPSRDVKFESYAITRIRGSVLDALKSLDWVPRSLRSTEQELKRAFAGLEARLGRAATDEEVADELGVSVDELYERLSDVGQSALLSFEEVMIYGEENSGLAGLCSSPDPDGDPLLSAELGERTELLATAISKLPEKEKLVISLYYSDGLTLKEIAAVLELTESRICQLHSKAVVRLHGKLARHEDLLLSAA